MRHALKPGQVYALDLSLVPGGADPDGDRGWAIVLVAYVWPKRGKFVWVSCATYPSVPTLADAENVTEWRWPILLASLTEHDVLLGTMPLPPELPPLPRLRAPRWITRGSPWVVYTYAEGPDGLPRAVSVEDTSDPTLPTGVLVSHASLRARVNDDWMPEKSWPADAPAPVVPAVPSTPVSTAPQPGAGRPPKQRRSRRKTAQPEPRDLSPRA
ncbi:hypothetical protein GCM10010921_24940 [Microbacterium album]|uniref:Uncharacterized protein n=2 Tax=Microbacterium album TaxID=2053191 RepID=A0A917IGK0_9MICO|nr:hypothetical protein GCM10010921_24940 [Microbacterium album]